MSRFKLKLEEGWTAFFFLLLMLLMVVGSAVAADWTRGLTILPWIVIAAVGLGTALAKARRIPAPIAHLLGLAAGIGLVGLALALNFQPPLVPTWIAASAQGILGRLGLIYDMTLQWFTNPAGAEPWLSNFVFTSILAVLAWLLSYVGSWFVFRTHWAWGAVVPAGAACLVNIYYAPPRLVFYFMLYCIFALLLVVRVHVYTRQQTWRKAEVNFNLDVDLTFLRDGMLVSMLALVLAWSFPVAARSPRLTEFWNSFQDTGERVRTMWNRFFTSLNYQGQSTLVEFGRTMVLGGAVNLANVPVLEVEASEPHYWRAVSYQTYSGSSWVNTDPPDIVLLADGQSLRPAPYAAQGLFTHTVTMLEPGENLLFFAGQPLGTSLSARASLSYVPIIDGGGRATDVSMLTALNTLGRDQSYQISALVSRAASNQLRAAGTDYPEWVTRRYLQLPSRLPQRVRALSTEIVKGAGTPFDAAEAIQSYLRRITYDQYISAPPPGQDVVDWFLFENRRGYCDYYATAMAVMCRANGIPARVSQGYTSGEYESDRSVYRVRQLDAHAWPEVFFPGYGWIAFEPTSSEPAIERSQVSDLSLVPGLLLPPASAWPEDEDKYGADDSLDEGADIMDVTLARSRPWYFRLLGLAAPLLALLLVTLIALIAWWNWSLRGLSVAASAYEQMRRVGSLLGVRQQDHQTPVEYGESLVAKLLGGRDQVRRLVALYAKQRFSGKELDDAEESELAELWRSLRALMWRQVLTPRLPRRRTRAPAWVPASSLRPPTSMN